MRTACLVTVATALLGCPAARAVPTIPDVATLADLRRLPPVPTDVGYDVRVGLADPGPDAGPYKLIYCLATPRPGPATRPDRNGSDGLYPLGPLHVELTTSDRLKAAVQRQASPGPVDAGPRLFCQSLPVGWADEVVVGVWVGKSLLLERPLGKSDRREAYWGTFAAEQRGMVNAWADADPAATPWPACPSFDGATSLLLRCPTGLPPADPPADAPLPGSGGPVPPWASFYGPPAAAGRLLTLSLVGDRFVLTPDGPDTDGRLSDRLLARWWVNGKPIPVPDHKGPWALNAMQEAMATLPSSSRRRAVRFGLPALLGPLRAAPGRRHGGLAVAVGRQRPTRLTGRTDRHGNAEATSAGHAAGARDDEPAGRHAHRPPAVRRRPVICSRPPWPTSDCRSDTPPRRRGPRPCWPSRSRC